MFQGETNQSNRLYRPSQLSIRNFISSSLTCSMFWAQEIPVSVDKKGGEDGTETQNTGKSCGLLHWTELLQAQGVCSHALNPTSISLLWPQHTALCRRGHGTVSAGRLQWVCKLQPPQHSHLQTGTASHLHPALPSVHATHTPRCPEISKGKQYSTGDQFPPAACLPDTKPHRAACGLRILPTLGAWVSFSVPSSLLGNQ